MAPDTAGTAARAATELHRITPVDEAVGAPHEERNADAERGNGGAHGAPQAEDSDASAMRASASLSHSIIA